jgi:hypothetical protein
VRYDIHIYVIRRLKVKTVAAWIMIHHECWQATFGTYLHVNLLRFTPLGVFSVLVMPSNVLCLLVQERERI